VKFLYEGTIEDLDEKDEQLLVVANKYKLKRLAKICENSVYSQLKPESSMRILKIAGEYKDSDEDLFNGVIQWICL
jgi:hypothetical protein